MSHEYTYKWGPATHWGANRIDMFRDGVRVAFAEFTKRKVAGHQALQIKMIQSWHNRQGNATRLYETLGKAACDKGLTLASDSTRSPAAEAFWQKQIRKGRAIPAGKKAIVLLCPVVTLAGAKRR
jgi:hypothetical protein